MLMYKSTVDRDSERSSPVFAGPPSASPTFLEVPSSGYDRYLEPKHRLFKRSDARRFERLGQVS